MFCIGKYGGGAKIEKEHLYKILFRLVIKSSFTILTLYGQYLGMLLLLAQQMTCKPCNGFLLFVLHSSKNP